MALGNSGHPVTRVLHVCPCVIFWEEEAKDSVTFSRISVTPGKLRSAACNEVPFGGYRGRGAADGGRGDSWTRR